MNICCLNPNSSTKNLTKNKKKVLPKSLPLPFLKYLTLKEILKQIENNDLNSKRLSIFYNAKVYSDEELKGFNH